MRRLVSFTVARPGWSVAAVAAITIALATQFSALRVNVSPRMLMVGDDPEIAYYEAALERFGSDELTLIA
jgi:uncharacterized membrane protein YdfJ with MMPL/SSD domain